MVQAENEDDGDLESGETLSDVTDTDPPSKIHSARGEICKIYLMKSRKNCEKEKKSTISILIIISLLKLISFCINCIGH